VIRERETEALERYVVPEEVVSSRLALVEVLRAVKTARPGGERASEAHRLLRACLLVAIDEPILLRAAELASAEIRALDAIHLATAEDVGPDEFVAYDRRLLAAAEGAGLRISSPGA
jgi:uncharacterized protein